MSLYNWKLVEEDGRSRTYEYGGKDGLKPGCYHFDSDHGVDNDIPRIEIESPDWRDLWIPDPAQEVSFSLTIRQDKDGDFIPSLYIHTIDGADEMIEFDHLVEELPDNVFISLQSIWNNRDDLVHSLEKITADALVHESELGLHFMPNDGLETVKIEFESPHLKTSVDVPLDRIRRFFVERKAVYRHDDLDPDCICESCIQEERHHV